MAERIGIESPFCDGARMTCNQKIIIPIPPGDWLLTNHRPHYHEKAAITKRIKQRTALLARNGLDRVDTPVAIYLRAYARGGVLPDADAISLMSKAIIDGLVQAKILAGDAGAQVPLVAYGRPERDRTLRPKHHAIAVVLTDSFMNF